MTSREQHQQNVTTLLAWLTNASKLDPSFAVGIDAYHFAARYHTGVRKDGTTPEMSHPVEIALRVIARLERYPDAVLFPVETLAASLLHDVLEDYGPTARVWRQNVTRLQGLQPVCRHDLVQAFGETITQAVDRLSKVVDGVTKQAPDYYHGLAQCPIASMGKGEDRGHNMDAMVNVFTLPKQSAYADEVDHHFFTMIDHAEGNFPQQAAVYDGLRRQLRKQVAQVRIRVGQGVAPLSAKETSDAHGVR